MSHFVRDPSTAVVEGLAGPGWACVPDFLSRAECLALAADGMTTWAEGEFRKARVGRGEHQVIREDIRRDHVRWLEPESMRAAERRYLETLEGLRRDLNRQLFLGLLDFEGHFAVYQPGAFYKPHLDRHQQTMDRVVTVILYLNEGWEPEHGGHLRLWTTPGAPEGESVLVEPRLGTMVVFLAGEHWHEVLPARKTRISITGWFRVRPA